MAKLLLSTSWCRDDPVPWRMMIHFASVHPVGVGVVSYQLGVEVKVL